MSKKPTIAEARDELKKSLETDFTGLIEAAALTWDQRVRYSIAISLKELNDQVREMRIEKRT